MRVVTWNCNLSLAKKLDSLLELDPDVAVIQECEEDLTVPEATLIFGAEITLVRGLASLLRTLRLFLSLAGKKNGRTFCQYLFPKRI